MNTRQLLYLVTIAEFGSLSHAARALNISQPALSRYLSDWEALCGQPLFTRSRKKLCPTAIGSLVSSYAQRILDEQNAMMLTIRTVTGNEQQSIRLCTAPYRAAILYSKIIKPFSRRFPEISLSFTELHAAEQPGAIVRGHVDVAIGAGSPLSSPDSVSDIPFAREELLISLPIAHPLARKRSIRLSELADTPFVLQSRKHNIRLVAEQLFEKAGFYPVIAFESDDVLLLDAMMRQGIGAGFVSRIHVSPCDEVAYLSLDPPVYQTQHIRYPKGHILTDAEAYLASLLVRERLQDARYEPIHSPEAEALVHVVEAVEEALPPAAPLPFGTGSSHVSIRSLSFDFKILEYIIAIVEERSLSRAGERYFLAQSALSRHLKNTEDMVGFALFSRKHNRLVPTKAGTVFINSARNMLRLYEEMKQKIGGYHNDSRKTLTLLCDCCLFAHLSCQSSSHTSSPPEVVLLPENGGESVPEEALQNASADLGIFFSSARNHPLLSYEVLAVTHLVYVPDIQDPIPGLKADAALPERLPPRRLYLSLAGTTLHAEQNRLASRLYDSPPTIASYADTQTLKALVSIGGGDIILPPCLLPEEARKNAHSFKVPQPLYLVLARNPSRPLPPGADAFTRWLHERIAALAEAGELYTRE